MPSIKKPTQVPLTWKKSKLPAHDPVFKDKIWLRTYKNNTRMKRAAVSIVDLHAEQQARQRRGEGSYSGQQVTCTAQHKHDVLPEIVLADDLITWYASCLRGSSHIKAMSQLASTRPTDVARWR